MSRSAAIPESPYASGMTLLEVLVACGLLVIALASVAALVPATGSRLSQATDADRSGLLATNARAEVTSRGLLAATLYSGTTVSGSAIALPPASYSFGRMLDRVVVSNASTGTKGKRRGQLNKVTSGTQPGLFPPNEDMVYSLVDFDRGFSLEDALVLATPADGGSPLSEFANGYRTSRDGFCWGALVTVTDTTAPVGPGTAAELSVAIFRKEGSVSTDTDANNGTPISLAGTFPLYTTTEESRASYLQPCSYALVLPSGTTVPAVPKWVKVTASWNDPSKPGLCLVVLGDDVNSYGSSVPDPDTGAAVPGLKVIGFQTLVRVDTYSVVLE